MISLNYALVMLNCKFYSFISICVNNCKKKQIRKNVESRQEHVLHCLTIIITLNQLPVDLNDE